MRRAAVRSWFALGAASLAASACASAPPPSPASPPPPPRLAHAVSAIVLVNHCAELSAIDARSAEKEMGQLVEGCGSFKGGSLRFTATLLPGGAMQFEPLGDGEPMIPICVLSKPLKHGVRLRKPCSLDILLEETSMTLPPAPPTPTER